MILVFGKTGQVATELQNILPDAKFVGRDEVDLCDRNAVTLMITQSRPTCVINAAAYTAVDNAESDEETAYLVNATAPGAMAETCSILDIPLVHISTDYVFDGTGELPFSTQDTPSPVAVYGKSKLEGERLVINSWSTYVILRTSWVFSAHGSNFVKTMLRLSESRSEISVVDDQVGGPTPARAIAEACISIANQLVSDEKKSGVYHFSGYPDVSWADFAREVFSQAALVTKIDNIPTSGFPTQAKRPNNSRLDCGSLGNVFSISRPAWKQGLNDVLKELDFQQ